MNKITMLACLGAIVPLASFNTARGATIANWTFETSIPTTAGPLAPEIGSGTATAVHADATASYTNPSGNGSAESWNSNRWAIGDYYQFQVSTVGQSGIVFSWDQTRSSSGPGQPAPNNANFTFQYSTDGTNFTSADYLVPVVDWTATTSPPYVQDLSSVTALNNQPTVYFRLTAIQSPQNTGGQSRVDNVIVSTVPEAGCAAMLLSLAVAAVLRRRVR